MMWVVNGTVDGAVMPRRGLDGAEARRAKLNGEALCNHGDAIVAEDAQHDESGGVAGMQGGGADAVAREGVRAELDGGGEDDVAIGAREAGDRVVDHDAAHGAGEREQTV